MSTSAYHGVYTINVVAVKRVVMSAYLQHPVVALRFIRQHCIHARQHLRRIQPQVLYLLQHIMHVLCWALKQVQNAEQQLTRSTGLLTSP